MVELFLMKYGFHVVDPIISVGIFAVLLKSGLELGSEVVNVLIDKVPLEVIGVVEDVARKVSGVREVIRIRARSSRRRLLMDIVIGIDP